MKPRRPPADPPRPGPGEHPGPERHDSEAPRRWPVPAYLLVFAAAVPWYWPAGDATLVLGIPAWVTVAIAGAVAAAGLTAWLLARPWPGESPGDD